MLEVELSRALHELERTAEVMRNAPAADHASRRWPFAADHAAKAASQIREVRYPAMIFNPARSKRARKRVQLDKLAALLVWQCRHGQASRADAARPSPNSQRITRRTFRDRLNHYREVKGSHEQQIQQP